MDNLENRESLRDQTPSLPEEWDPTARIANAISAFVIRGGELTPESWDRLLQDLPEELRMKWNITDLGSLDTFMRKKWISDFQVLSAILKSPLTEGYWLYSIRKSLIQAKDPKMYLWMFFRIALGIKSLWASLLLGQIFSLVDGPKNLDITANEKIFFAHMPDTWYEAWFDKLFIPSEKNTEIIECITDFLRKYHTVHKGTENYAPWKLDRLLAYVRTHPKISPHIEGSVLRRYLTWEQTPSLYVPEESFLSLKSTPFVLAYQTNNPDLLFPEGLRNVAPVEKEKYIQQELLSLRFAILQRHIQWRHMRIRNKRSRLYQGSTRSPSRWSDRYTIFRWILCHTLW